MRPWLPLLAVAAIGCSHDWDQLSEGTTGAGGATTASTTSGAGGSTLMDGELCDALCNAWDFCVAGFPTCAAECKTAVGQCSGADQLTYNQCLPILEECGAGSDVSRGSFQACLIGRCDLGFFD